jgi:hypothetical protein
VVAVGAVATAFGIASLLAAVWILPPLWRRKGTMAPLGRAGRLIIPAWFAALGMGFMVFEIATAQRLHLLLGDPTWALALTLAPLTLAAGLGATLSERLDPTSGRTLLLLPGMAAGVIALWALSACWWRACRGSCSASCFRWGCAGCWPWRRRRRRGAGA